MVNKLKSYGLFGANVYAVRDSNSTEENNEYSAFDSELTDEIKALLEARGYIVMDLFLDFNKQEVCTETDLLTYETIMKKSQIKANNVYLKGTTICCRLD